MDNGFTSAAFWVVLAIALIELILSAKWVSWYFTFGIPIFRKTARLEQDKRPKLDPMLLQNSFVSDGWQKLLFHSLDTKTIAIREKLFNFAKYWQYTPIMRGVVRFDETASVVTITGYLNWTTVLIIAFFLLLPFYIFQDFISMGFVIFLFIVLAYIYKIQAARYTEVLDLVTG